MPTLPFPLWIVTKRQGLVSQPVVPDGAEGFAAVFSSAEAAAKYMSLRSEPAWETTLVFGLASLAQVVPDLRHAGMEGLCLNPGPPQGAGVKIMFNEIQAG